MQKEKHYNVHGFHVQAVTMKIDCGTIFPCDFSNLPNVQSLFNAR